MRNAYTHMAKEDKEGHLERGYKRRERRRQRSAAEKIIPNRLPDDFFNDSVLFSCWNKQRMQKDRRAGGKDHPLTWSPFFFFFLVVMKNVLDEWTKANG